MSFFAWAYPWNYGDSGPPARSLAGRSHALPSYAPVRLPSRHLTRVSTSPTVNVGFIGSGHDLQDDAGSGAHPARRRATRVVPQPDDVTSLAIAGWLGGRGCRRRGDVAAGHRVGQYAVGGAAGARVAATRHGRRAVRASRRVRRRSDPPDVGLLGRTGPRQAPLRAHRYVAVGPR